ncbi:MAG: hypothetical protein EOP06_00500 [Proteobacteria bacterium]|nr:MAG: hypothetical protein EOP06_00500 [Pseudomonadota bacterium]
MPSIVQALHTIGNQLEADIKEVFPEVVDILREAPLDDSEAPYAIMRLSVENYTQHALDGSVELEAVFILTIVKTPVAGVVPLTTKISDSSKLVSKLKSTKRYASTAIRTSIDIIEFENLGDAQINEEEFSVTVRFFLVGTEADG